MAATYNTTATTTAAAALLGEYWDSMALDNVWPELFFYQFAEKKLLPGGVGKTIHFTKFTKFVDRKMASLSESGDDVLSPSMACATEISATVSQYGCGVLFSDFLLLTSRFNLIDEALEHLGMEAGRFVDQHIVDEIKGKGWSRVAGGGLSATSVTSLTVEDVGWASTRLSKQLTKRFRTGAYVGLIDPGAAHNIKTGVSGGWMELNKYTDGNIRELKAWSLGRISNIDWFETTNGTSLVSNDAASANFSPAMTLSALGTSGAYVTRIFGAGAYGAVNIEGGAISTFVKRLGSAGWRDLVNQRAGVGIKLFFGSIALNMRTRCVDLYSARFLEFE